MAIEPVIVETEGRGVLMQGSLPHERSEKIAAQVRFGAALGMAADTLANLIGEVSRDTILRHYRHELENGRIEANMKIGAAIFNSGIGEEVICQTCDGSKKKDNRRCPDCRGKGKIWVREPNATSQIWWSKNMMGWSDQQRIEHTGPGGGPILTEQVSAATSVRKRLDAIADKINGTKAE